MNYTYRVKLGATTVLATAATAFPTSASRRSVRATIDVLVGSTIAQRCSGLLVVGPALIAPTFGNITTAGTWVGYAASAEDTATAKQVQMTVQLGTAAAAAEFVAHGATLEVVRKA